MKKLFACIMAAFVCLASCAFAFVMPASAAEDDIPVKGWFRYTGIVGTDYQSEIFIGRAVAFTGWGSSSLPTDIAECRGEHLPYQAHGQEAEKSTDCARFRMIALCFSVIYAGN